MIDLDFKVIKCLYRSQNFMKVGELSTKMDIAHSTLGSCIGRLKKKGHVIYKAYHTVELTESGKDLARELIRHSKLLELLLFHELGLSAEEAHEESEKFNLLFSCNTINKICEKYDHPKNGPCKELIPNSESCFCEKIT
ncbi:MAG TPA: iron dependent repressor, metal binding and dimerization domain protein [Candidatus Lokiarchaeia archaeon]